MEPQIHFVRAYHRSACKRHRDSALRNSVSCARHRLSPPSTVLIIADERRCAPHTEFRAEQVRRTLRPCPLRFLLRPMDLSPGPHGQPPRRCPFTERRHPCPLGPHEMSIYPPVITVNIPVDALSLKDEQPALFEQAHCYSLLRAYGPDNLNYNPLRGHHNPLP